MHDLAARAERYLRLVEDVPTISLSGRVERSVGLVVESVGPPASVGEICAIQPRGNVGEGLAEVVGFRGNRTLLMPLSEMYGVAPGSRVRATGAPLSVPVGQELLGRVIDGLGRPLDDRGPLGATERRPIVNAPPHPLARNRAETPIATGIKAIDGLLTCARGQRMGIFAGSGVGKSVLLGMIARNTEADVNVIALVGERGREVREFLERDLGEAGLARSVVVAATSDRPAPVRLKAAMVATTIAEYFREAGMDVMMMMDSVTRLAMAQREIGLAAGEPPTTKGYPPSVFGFLPRLLERAGNSAEGSITGLYSVLVEGDDMNDPIADTVRSILDGHIVLSRKIASANHYPAIDVLESVSRMRTDVISDEHRKAAGETIEMLGTYREAEDLINIGAYVHGSSPRIDRAIAMIDRINDYLRQDVNETAAFDESVARLTELPATVSENQQGT